MRKKFTQNFYGKFVAGFMAVALFISGLCFFGADGNVAFASDSVATMHDNGYYVKPYTATEFEAFRSGTYTYPTLLASDCADYQNWLFAGWFTDADCTKAVEDSTKSVTETVYAKYVDADLSYIKCQVTPGTDMGSEKANMRLISTLESGHYSGAGYYIKYKSDEAKRYPVTTIYKRLSATEDGMECGYSPIAFNADAQYFSAFQMKNLGNANFDEPIYIQSYWVTLDGTEVLGMSRYARIEDSYEKIVNVPVRVNAKDVDITSGSVSVAYDTTQFSLYQTDEYPNGYDNGTIFDSVEVSVNETESKFEITGTSGTAKTAEGVLVNLRLKLKDGATLQSNTEFEVGDESFSNGETAVTLDVADVLFKNYPVAYNGSVDKSWYDGFEDNQTFVISTAADLYGLAEIVNDTENDAYKDEQFADNEIILGADINVNKGKASIDGWDTTQDADGVAITDGTAHEWTPIGHSSSHRFHGVFNGNGNTISGIYFVDDEDYGAYYSGLFGITGAESKLRNFRLENSFFQSVVGWGNGTETSLYALMGSVAGQLAGDAYSIYSNAYVNSANQRAGGLFGVTNPGSDSGVFYIDDCWFDGEVYATQEAEAASKYIGGIVGDHLQGNVVMTNCLNTGDVTLSYTTANDDANSALCVGGLVGGIQNSGASVSISKSLNTGYVVAKEGSNAVVDQNGVGSIVGYINSGKTVKVSNVVATTESTAKRTIHNNKGSLIDEEGVATTVSTQAKTSIIGCASYEAASALGIYAYDVAKDLTEEDEPLCWVVTENGTPELKTFCDEWIDVGWYYNENYVINTAEEFYGFSAISADGVTFSGKEVSLGKDIELNSGNAVSWVAGKTEANRALKPIEGFAGMFNGQGKEISGLYMNTNTTDETVYTGLFGSCTGTVKDFSLTNSYVTSVQATTASVVAFPVGATIENIYSDAYVHSTNGNTGGIVGYAYTEGVTTNITGCWFAGEVKHIGTNKQYVGGILGRQSEGTVRITDCLFTGSVDTARTSGNAYAGGIIGGVYAGTDVTGVSCYVADCVSNGRVTATSSTGATASVVGATSSASGNNKAIHTYVENVYTATTVSSGGTLNTNYSLAGFGYPTYQRNAVDGSPLELSDAELSDDNAYVYTKLTFRDSDEDTDGTGAWVATANGPELYNFSDTKTTSTFEGVEKINTDWYCDIVKFDSGEQTVTSFAIDDAADFRGLPVLVNNQIENFSGCTVSINEDTDVIDLNEGWVATVDENGDLEEVASNVWTPIGTSDSKFAGKFDGNKATISGVYVASSTQNGLGLFGHIDGATIQDVKVKNSYLEYAGSQEITANDDGTYTATTKNAIMGSIVGYAYDNCSLINVYSDAIVRSSGRYNGGLIGYSAASAADTTSVTMESCWFDGDIRLSYAGANMRSGGVLGYIAKGVSTFDTCLYSGSMIMHYTCLKQTNTFNSMIGGFVGADVADTSSVNFKNSISDGTICFYWKDYATTFTASKMNDLRMSDTIGTMYNDNSNTDGTVLALTEITSKQEVGDAEEKTIGYAYVDDSGNKTENTNFTEIVEDTDLLEEKYLFGLGWRLHTDLCFTEADRVAQDNVTGPIWAARLGMNPAPATLVDDALDITVDRMPAELTGAGTEGDPYLITSVADLYRFSMLSREKNFSGEHVKLTADLTVNTGKAQDWKTSVAALAWYVIAPKNDDTTRFAGTFDGQGHTISGIYGVDDNTYFGLFGLVSAEGTVKNLKLTNSYFEQRGAGYVGSVAADMRGTIDTVYSDAIVKSVGAQTGGIVARANGVKYTLVEAEVVEETTTTDQETGNVTIERTEQVTYGRKTVSVKNCWFAGEINVNVTVKDTYVGGVAGCHVQGRVNMDNCLFTGTIHANETTYSEYVGGLVGGLMNQSTVTTEKATTSVTDEETSVTTTTNITTNATYIYADTEEYAVSTLNLDSSIAAGEIVASGSNARIGAIVGYAASGSETKHTVVSFTNTYATRDTYSVAHNYSGTVTNLPILTYNTDRLIGYCVEEAYNSTLDFANDWSMRISGVPIPKVFEKVVGTDQIVDSATLTAEIGLDTWGKTLAEAVDYGMGNYVVSADATYETYSAYLTKLDDELDFELYVNNSASDMDEDGVYNAIYTKEAGDWVLDITFVKNEGKIYISISTIGVEGLSGSLLDSDANKALAKTEGTVSLSMLELVNAQQYGNGFVFQLPNGHFIVNDGGKSADAEQLVTYLRQLAGTNNSVIIDAWIFTHMHSDHCGAAQGFYSDESLRQGVYVEAIYLSESSNYSKTYHSDQGGTANSTFRSLMMLTKQDGTSKPSVYRMHMGERYYFSGLTMDVVQTQEQIPVSTYNAYKDPDKFNATSTNCVYTMTETGKKVLLGGDSTNVNMQYMMTAYGKNYEVYNHETTANGGTSKTLSNINVFATYHHGKNTTADYGTGTVDVNGETYTIKGIATYEWADYLLKNTNNPSGFKFDSVLFPYHQVFHTTAMESWTTSAGTTYDKYYVGDDGSVVFPYNMTEINQYFIDNAESYYTYGYEDYVDDVLTTNETRHGTVQFIYKTDEDDNVVVSTVIHGAKVTTDAEQGETE